MGFRLIADGGKLLDSFLESFLTDQQRRHIASKDFVFRFLTNRQRKPMLGRSQLCGTCQHHPDFVAGFRPVG